MTKSTLAISALFLTTAAFAQTREEKPLDAHVAKTVAPAYAASSQTWKDLGEGTYSDFVLSNLFVGYFNDPVKVMVQESEQTPGLYRVVNPWKPLNENTPFDDELNYLIIDATDPDFVQVPEQQSPVADAVDGETWYCSYTYYMVDIWGGIDKESFKERQPDKVPVLKDGVIKFTQNCMAVMYPYGTGSEFDPGTWSYTNMEYEGYLELPGAEVDDDWESIGTGTFLEGFVETVFDSSYVAQEQQKEIMKHKTVEGVYKVCKAFDSPTSRDLIIDARQRDFVRVEQQNTGIDTDRGWLYIMSCSTNGLFTTYDEMVMSNPDYATRNITMDDKGIYFPKTSILLYFPTSGDEYVYNNGNAVDSYLLFPGVQSIKGVGENDYDAPAEYFNLQGMRVAQPQSGELVIVRKGSKTFKTIVR